MVGETPVKRPHSTKKNQERVPKRIHKAEREKMKREHLNELFLALANSLELSQQNSGKAFTLGEACRILKEMLSQIETLKKENASLLSESQYVNMEKKELQDENSVLGVQVGKLQREIEERVVQSKPDLNAAPLEHPRPELSAQLPTETALQRAPIVSPVFVIPLHSDLQPYQKSDTAQIATTRTSNVSKPHARYPTPSDSWPSQLLGKHTEAAADQQNAGTNNRRFSREELRLGNL